MGRPNRGGRPQFSSQLVAAASRLINERQQRPAPPVGIQPHLVFRIPYAEGTSVNQLIESLQEQAGLDIVSTESDRAVVAFRDEVNLNDFLGAVAKYRDGPREGINTRTGKPFSSTNADFLEFIEPDGIRPWGKEDRIGSRLREIIGGNGERIDHSRQYVVDLELWHPGGSEGARRALDEVRKMVESGTAGEGRVLDRFAGQFLVLSKVSIPGSGLNTLLNLDIVAEVDLPPKPSFDPMRAERMTPRDFPIPPRPQENGPRLCVVDSGITANHPLLANNVGHEEAILTETSSPSDAHGHGTMVAGLAVFGDVRACYDSGAFTSPITLFSARVLNDRNGFDDQKLIINQMREAIEVFVRPPYDCRVFNFSLGTDTPAIDPSRPRQTLWAEQLDVLARELQVILIVSTGNHREGLGANAEDAETALRAYPAFLFNSSTGLCDPATAAIAVSVGSLSQRSTPAVVVGSGADDITQPVAGVDEPSPFTRIGPGINDAIKPEFVHYGGNLAFSGFGSSNRTIAGDAGMDVMSFSHQPTQRLFSYDRGTSFAAPQVARLAALIEHGLSTDLGERPSPNLIRAVLASSSEVPEASARRLGSFRDGTSLHRVCGYGLPSESIALKSMDRRVTMVYQGSMAIDNFDIFEVPIPDEFRYAHGERKIVVSLAYDPPVRRRNQDYIGIAMEFILIRGQPLDAVYESFRLRPSGFDSNSKYRMNFDISASARKKCTLQRGIYVLKRPENDVKGYGNEYYLVVRSERKWAPSDIHDQAFGLAVTLIADDPHLYSQVALRIRQRIQARARAS